MKVSARVVLHALTFLAGAGALSGQTITHNTKRVGFVDLGPTGTKGTWSYASGGRCYALQTRGDAGLAIIDTTNTRSPRLVANVPGDYRKVQVYRNYAYATTDDGPTEIIDLTLPSQPRIAGTLATGGHTLRIEGDRLYLNRADDGLFLYDLTTPTAPRFLGSWDGEVHDCRPDGNTVYTHGEGGKSHVLDVSDPANIVELASMPKGNHSSALYRAPTGDRILLTCDEVLGGQVHLYNVNDPAAPKLLSAYRTSSPNVTVHNVEVKGVYAYVAYYQDQLRVVDLRNLANPQEVGVWDNNPTNFGPLFSDSWEAIPDHDAVYLGQMGQNLAGPAGLHLIDFFPGFGQGSVGTIGRVPEIWWSFGPPSPGNQDFELRLTKARPNARAWLVMGLSKTAWGSRSLPMNLAPYGASNASLYVAPQIVIPARTDDRGKATIALPVPASLAGATFYAQWVIRDPGAPNPGKWAVSGAGELVIW